eukprot:TRINITY_DN4355_c0_g2_i1.p1 TRINITY_DN4355_c0_g2~~TRINITY_DN4355_c0_g2_i1.p1  ORF type:complete len:152 (-),score=3.50 TRINITY_DN4355_c0_g2_i1:174-629(-)
MGLLTLTAYSNVDWAGDRTDRRFTTGYCIFLGPNPISWCAKKQRTIAPTFTESEYRPLARTTADITWVQTLLKDLLLRPPHPPILPCDNISVISLASNPVFHAHTKHIKVDYHFIHKKVVNNEIQVRHVSTIDQIVNIFTKSLSSLRHNYL